MRGLHQVYTGSKDETVRVWDVATGKCTSVVQVGGHVDSLLMESGYLFVGMHITNTPDQPGLIKVRLSHSAGFRVAVGVAVAGKWHQTAWSIAQASEPLQSWQQTMQQYWQKGNR